MVVKALKLVSAILLAAGIVLMWWGPYAADKMPDLHDLHRAAGGVMVIAAFIMYLWSRALGEPR